MERKRETKWAKGVKDPEGKTFPNERRDHPHDYPKGRYAQAGNDDMRGIKKNGTQAKKIDSAGMNAPVYKPITSYDWKKAKTGSLLENYEISQLSTIIGIDPQSIREFVGRYSKEFTSKAKLAEAFINNYNLDEFEGASVSQLFETSIINLDVISEIIRETIETGNADEIGEAVETSGDLCEAIEVISDLYKLSEDKSNKLFDLFYPDNKLKECGETESHSSADWTPKNYGNLTDEQRQDFNDMSEKDYRKKYNE